MPTLTEVLERYRELSAMRQRVRDQERVDEFFACPDCCMDLIECRCGEKDE